MKSIKLTKKKKEIGKRKVCSRNQLKSCNFTKNVNKLSDKRKKQKIKLKITKII